MTSRAKTVIKTVIAAALFGAAGLTATQPARAEAQLLIEAASGKVLYADNANYPWYPASLTKLMTLYVTLQALRERRITGDTLITVSERSAAQAPAKMGFKAGTRLTLDNAMKMMMVKSANDMAFTIAEGVSGSIENFAADMNSTAHRLGMVQSSYVNPNGLPDENQISSARDLGILARSLIRDFPEYNYYWHLPGIKFGKRVTRNFNKLIGRYPGADGMKTGYICASGFNLVATATRNGRQLIAVVLGAPSSAIRSEKAASLLERGFNSGDGLAWLRPSPGTVDALPPIAASPPDLREEMCGKNRKKPASETDDDEAEVADKGGEGGQVMSLRPQTPKFSFAALPQLPLGDPVEVFVGVPKQAAKPASGAAPGAKPVAVTSVQGKPAAPAKPGAVPGDWSSLNPTPLAQAAPKTMGSVMAEKPRTVPLPRPRPAAKPKPTAAAVKPPA